MGYQLQLAGREGAALPSKTRCSYSCSSSKSLARRREMVLVVNISRVTQVQAVGLLCQPSHIQDYRTTYHSMLTTPFRVLFPGHTDFTYQSTGLLTTINLSPCFLTFMVGLNTQPAMRKTGTISLPLLTRMSLVDSWSSHRRAWRMLENLPTATSGAAGIYPTLKDPWETSVKQTGTIGRAQCATTPAPPAILQAPVSGPPAMMTLHTHSLCWIR